MSGQSGSPVECPVCGEDFDPSAAGGWCTNSDCGEYQHEGAVADASGSEGDSDGDATLDGEADPRPIITPVLEETTDESAEGDAADEDASAIEDADPGDVDGPESGATGAGDEGAPPADDGLDADAVCPDCGASVEPEDAFCRECGQALDDEETTLSECPDCAADVEPTDSFCPACGTDLAAARDDRAGGRADSTDGGNGDGPSSLVLRSNDSEVAVASGDTVGREVRRILTEAGADESEAVRVHREHVRFIHEDGRFYLVDLGDNPTAVNGDHLSKGDRRPVGPGDEIELSGVVTLTVAEP